MLSPETAKRLLTLPSTILEGKLAAATRYGRHASLTDQAGSSPIQGLSIKKLPSWTPTI
jgi:hypothetical protein